MNEVGAHSAVAVGRRGRGGLGSPRWDWVVSVAALALWLLGWELAIRVSIVDPRHFLPPSAILPWLARPPSEASSIWPHLGITAQRFAIGYLLGAVPALGLGLLMARWHGARAVGLPFLAIFGLCGGLPFFPLIMLLVGLGEPGKWIVVALGVFWPVVYAVHVVADGAWRSGGGRAATESGGAGTVFGVGGVRWVFLALHLSMALGLTTLVISEFVGAKSGLGYVIWDSFARFTPTRLYTGIVAMNLLAAAMWLLLAVAERLVRPGRWRWNRASAREEGEQMRHLPHQETAGAGWSRWLLGVGAVGGWLLSWEVAIGIGILGHRFYQAPSELLRQLANYGLFGSGDLVPHLWLSVTRLAWGLLLGVPPGVAVGILLARSRWARAAAVPILAAWGLYPMVAVFPLVMLVFGLGETSIWALVALGVFWPTVWGTTIALGAAWREVPYATDSMLPGLPTSVSARRAATGAWLLAAAPFVVSVAVTCLFAGEMVGAKTGLGFMVWQSWQTFAVEWMHATILSIVMLCLVLWLLLAAGAWATRRWLGRAP